METLSPTPVPEALDYTEKLEEIVTLLSDTGVDYSEKLNDLEYILSSQSNLIASQSEVLQGMYVCMLFAIGVAGAIFVVLLLYNFLKKCY